MNDVEPDLSWEDLVWDFQNSSLEPSLARSLEPALESSLEPALESFLEPALAHSQDPSPDRAPDRAAAPGPALAGLYLMPTPDALPAFPPAPVAIAPLGAIGPAARLTAAGLLLAADLALPALEGLPGDWGSDLGARSAVAAEGAALQVATPYFYDRTPPGSYDFTFHRNWDMAVDVPAPCDGTVKRVWFQGRTGNLKTGSGAGNIVQVDCSDYGWLFGHFDRVAVQPGQRVVAGQPLGVQGCTGRCSGPHVHLQIHRRSDWQRISDRATTEPLVRAYLDRATQPPTPEPAIAAGEPPPGDDGAGGTGEAIAPESGSLSESGSLEALSATNAEASNAGAANDGDAGTRADSLDAAALSFGISVTDLDADAGSPDTPTGDTGEVLTAAAAEVPGLSGDREASNPAEPADLDREWAALALDFGPTDAAIADPPAEALAEPAAAAPLSGGETSPASTSDRLGVAFDLDPSAPESSESGESSPARADPPESSPPESSPPESSPPEARPPEFGEPDRVLPPLSSAKTLFSDRAAPGAIAVGHAEGNLTADGEIASIYYGHADPGNGVQNQGFCSLQRYLWKDFDGDGKTTPQEADRTCLELLQSQAIATEAALTDRGYPTAEAAEALVNCTDLYNQSRVAGRQCPERYRQARQEQGLDGEAAYVWARVESFRVASGELSASGLFRICRQSPQRRHLSNWDCIASDQRRRVRAIRRALAQAAEARQPRPG